MKIKATREVVNRGWKRYIAQDGYIEVDQKDLIHFNITDENTQEDHKEVPKPRGKARKSA